MVSQRVTRSKSREAQKNGSSNGSSNGHQKNGHSAGGEDKSLYGQNSAWVSFVHHTFVPLFLMFFSPNLVIILWYTAAKCNGSFLTLFREFAERGTLNSLVEIWSNIRIGSPLAVYTLLGYMVFAASIQMLLPGPRAEGPLTPKGNVPVYKDNGFKCYIVTMLALGGLTYYLKQHGLTPTVVYDHFDEFLGTMTVFSHILCMFLHLKGLVAPSSTDSGSSGNLIFDFYWGTELYPRIFGLDIKVFTNCRFGMTVWPLLCTIFAIKNYELYGFVDSCWVTWLLQMIYFTKFFWWEAGYMRTIDIMVDRAGFYICWGCLVYVPGLYASVSLYMTEHPVVLGPVVAALLVIAGASSIIINFLADKQKQDVRGSNGKCLIWGKKPEVIRAKYTIGKYINIILLCQKV